MTICNFKVLFYFFMIYALVSCRQQEKRQFKNPSVKTVTIKPKIKTDSAKVCLIDSIFISLNVGLTSTMNFININNKVSKIMRQMDDIDEDSEIYIYDDRGRLSKIKNDKKVQEYIYDKSGKLIKIKGRGFLMYSFTFEYNEKGQIRKQSVWDGTKLLRQIEFSYGEDENPVSSQVVEFGKLITSHLYFYDNKVNPFNEAIPFGQTENYPVSFAQNNLIKEITTYEEAQQSPPFRQKGEKVTTITIYEYNDSGYPVRKKFKSGTMILKYNCLNK